MHHYKKRITLLFNIMITKYLSLLSNQLYNNMEYLTMKKKIIRFCIFTFMLKKGQHNGQNEDNDYDNSKF